ERPGAAPPDTLVASILVESCRSRDVPPSGAAPLRPDSVELTLLLLAYDSAYTRYARERVDGRPGYREGTAGPGLDGARGVFGSAFLARRRATVVVTD
ncbi:MAG TPA: hypothetical protein VF263_19235, partial [Longimicrobiaceae bacterium]